MPAPTNNQFWKLRSTHGREKIFHSKEQLWKEACEFFAWCDANPLVEEKVFGTGKRMEVKHPRPYTIQGLCFFLEIGIRTWNDYKNKPGYEDFSPVIEQIELVVFEQKFSGAAVGFFAERLITRDLGLVDKNSIEFEDFTEDQLDDIINRLVKNTI